MIVGVHHIAISVPDVNAAADFYIDVLGFEEVFDVDWASGNDQFDRIIGLDRTACKIRMLRTANIYFEIWEYENPAPEPLDHNYSPANHGIAHFCLQVDDIDAEYERLRAAGMKFVNPPQHADAGAAVYGRDPFGHIIEIYQPSAELSLPRPHAMAADDI